MGLPKRLKELEDRVAALEAKPAAVAGPACPICQAPMRTTAVTADPTFGDMGLQQHSLACTRCAHAETRQVDPNKAA
ncbi:hypothetical protein [Methylobacterium sp. BTF04]|uniref:hypothetical protein n=1 Tax=Methylobacterium sp. BTF04 TaxID=2708300 RepID=UPI001FEF3FB9|nr:hypothetical protein [Methylobacterium sp. BTF04]